MTRGWRPWAVAAFALWACPKSEAPTVDETDRTIQKLKAEQDRLRRAGQPSGPPRPVAEPDPLAEIAAAPAHAEHLGTPSGVAGELGAISLRLIGVEAAQTVGERVRLSTTERFLTVRLEASAAQRTELELSGARLLFGDREFPLARDAQRAAGGTSLATVVGAGKPKELVLLFEVPPDAITRGLKIVLSSAQSRVELPLQ